MCLHLIDPRATNGVGILQTQLITSLSPRTLPRDQLCVLYGHGTDASLRRPVMPVHHFPKAQMSISSHVRSDDPSAPTCLAHQSRPLKVASAQYPNAVRKTA